MHMALHIADTEVSRLAAALPVTREGMDVIDSSALLAIVLGKPDAQIYIDAIEVYVCTQIGMLNVLQNLYA
jgi:hypothetical protein